MSYETGKITHTALRTWPELQMRLSKVNWSKVAERARALIVDSITVTSNADALVGAAAAVLRRDPGMTIHELPLSQILSGEFSVAPNTCLLVLSLGGGSRSSTRGVKLARHREPTAKALLLATRVSPMANACHFGIMPPGMDDFTSIGPTAGLVLMTMTALVGEWVRPGAYQQLCTSLSVSEVDKRLESAFHPLVQQAAYRRNGGVIWTGVSQMGIAQALADAANRMTGQSWTAVNGPMEVDKQAFHVYLNLNGDFQPDKFSQASGIVIGGQSASVANWGFLPLHPDSSPLTVYQVGLEVCWQLGLWQGSNPDDYFSSFSERLPSQ